MAEIETTSAPTAKTTAHPGHGNSTPSNSNTANLTPLNHNDANNQTNRIRTQRPF